MSWDEPSGGRSGAGDGVMAAMLKRAIDVVPYLHKVPLGCEIVGRRWSDDGTTIWFMLDNHTFFDAAPGDLIEVEELQPERVERDWFKKSLAADAARMVNRPRPYAGKCVGLGSTRCVG